VSTSYRACWWDARHCLVMTSWIYLGRMFLWLRCIEIMELTSMTKEYLGRMLIRFSYINNGTISQYLNIILKKGGGGENFITNGLCFIKMFYSFSVNCLPKNDYFSAD
jgi:hypothetical protein